MQQIVTFMLGIVLLSFLSIIAIICIGMILVFFLILFRILHRIIKGDKIEDILDEEFDFYMR